MVKLPTNLFFYGGWKMNIKQMMTITDKESRNLQIDIQVLLQLLIRKNIVTLEEIDSVRKEVENNWERRKMGLELVESCIKENGESHELHMIATKLLVGERITYEDKKILMEKLNNHV